MPELEGEERLRYLGVLKDGIRFNGYVIFEGEARKALDEHLGSHSQKSLTEAMYAYASHGGKISKVEEVRERWRDLWHCHYDLWPTIDGRRLYFETRLDERDASDPVIRVVNIHPPEDVRWD
jgi:hypothetical protein